MDAFIKQYVHESQFITLTMLIPIIGVVAGGFLIFFIGFRTPVEPPFKKQQPETTKKPIKRKERPVKTVPVLTEKKEISNKKQPVPVPVTVTKPIEVKSKQKSTGTKPVKNKSKPSVDIPTVPVPVDFDGGEWQTVGSKFDKNKKKLIESPEKVKPPKNKSPKKENKPVVEPPLLNAVPIANQEKEQSIVTSTDNQVTVDDFLTQLKRDATNERPAEIVDNGVAFDELADAWIEKPAKKSKKKVRKD